MKNDISECGQLSHDCRGVKIPGLASPAKGSNMDQCLSVPRGLVAVLCASFAVCSAFSQEKSSPPDLAVKKVINPSLLGLDSATSVSAAGYPGSFYLGEGPGGKQIMIEITPKPVKIGNQRRVEQLLEENGIRFDANAVSFVYYLNPDL